MWFNHSKTPFSFRLTLRGKSLIWRVWLVNDLQKKRGDAIPAIQSKSGAAPWAGLLAPALGPPGSGGVRFRACGVTLIPDWRIASLCVSPDGGIVKVPIGAANAPLFEICTLVRELDLKRLESSCNGVLGDHFRIS